MIRVHKKIKYALTALKYMKAKKPGELTTAKEICGHFGIPFDPTSRVLQIMAQREILEAVQGAYGGYRLIADLSRHTLYELSLMIIGPFAMTDCSEKDGACERIDKCILKDAMARLNGKVLKVFKDVKVSEMM
ncbi:MAG: Rrf2 family transcriptional regulator [Candidatus Omnitrophica bacterium]|nr:Rrf2 family transcriptional regulator [Candidatus Omnitrophota bacterium]